MMFCYPFCNKQPWLPRGAMLSTLLLTMMTEKLMTSTFVEMAVAEAQASLQVLWGFIAMARGHDWLD
jgi:hypothetical protein